ncbi:MAG: hypothetical protein HYZ75_14845 [Elusimicrobia bacterium]|nr:hypothetical protein [Elusimicrobiota bacterium]
MRETFLRKCLRISGRAAANTAFIAGRLPARGASVDVYLALFRPMPFRDYSRILYLLCEAGYEVSVLLGPHSLRQLLTFDLGQLPRLAFTFSSGVRRAQAAALITDDPEHRVVRALRRRSGDRLRVSRFVTTQVLRGSCA